MSKHELDCPLSTIDSDVDAKDCVFCPIARAAYRRGREDAAKALLDACIADSVAHCEPAEACGHCLSVAAAARGDGA